MLMTAACAAMIPLTAAAARTGTEPIRGHLISLYRPDQGLFLWSLIWVSELWINSSLSAYGLGFHPLNPLQHSFVAHPVVQTFHEQWI